jgi:rhamnose transport system ATP-binding protein
LDQIQPDLSIGRRLLLLNPFYEMEYTGQLLLQAFDIQKHFGAVKALKGVSFDLLAGEVHALVGENGAGKSTLIKILTGAVQPDSGLILFQNQPVERNSPAKARALGISVIYQQPALFPDLSVAENIAFAQLSKSPWERVDWKARREHAARLLERIGAKIRPEASAGSLSMPEQQLVEIAKAVDADAKVLIMDEPTAALGDQDAENLFRLMNDLRSKGTGIIYISHRFEELFRLADRVTVLRDGSSIQTCPMAAVTTEDLIHMMVGRELETVFPKRETHLGETVLEVRNLSCRALGVKNVSLFIRSGEVLGLAGLIGSGRSQFAQALFGLATVDSGEILLHGRKLTVQSPADALRAGLAYVPEDRRRHGLILDMSIAANSTLASLGKISNGGGFLNTGAEKRLATHTIQQLGVKAPSSGTLARDLSGGNQQKVALGRWLMTDPKVLILDEPTQGIDVGAKSEIYQLIGQLAHRGMAILMISSETPEILAMSDRIAVMTKGTIAGTLERNEATPQALLQLALGHNQPAKEVA